MALRAAFSRPATSGALPSREPAAPFAGLGLRCFAAALLAGVLGLAQAAKPHQHGVAELEIAVDRSRISLRLDVPLDNLLGFERAPRTDAERSQAQAVVKQLSDATTLVRMDSAAGCSVTRVALESAELGLPESPVAPALDAKEDHKPVGKDNGHADLVADYEFTCADTTKARAVNLGLFETFPRLRRIEVQTVTPRGQLKAVLVRPNGRVALAR
jgi:hypothetical protein